MKTTHNVTKHVVYSTWLLSELYRVKSTLTDAEIAIIENPNLQNPNENIKRENLLYNTYGRSAILKTLPSDVAWHEVIIESDDVNKIYILPVFDWFMDTGKTFKLADTKDNLAPNRGYDLGPLQKEGVTHYQQIEEMAAANRPQDNSIIMISSTTSSGPYTIIDGTHRATFLNRKNQLESTKGFLGVSSNLSTYIWSIERSNIQESLRELNQYAEAGMLW